MVNINTVYQTVLALDNKEQRGYITPQEFNLFANQAQMSIFEQYFYDLSQFSRIPGNNTDYADAVNNLEQKISEFELYNIEFPIVSSYGDVDINNVNDMYRLGHVRVVYDNGPRFILASKLSLKELTTYAAAPLIRNNKKSPYYTKYNSTSSVYKQRIKVYPYPIPPKDKVYISYVRKPITAYWGYTVVGEAALYDPTKSSNFELHVSEENDLVIKILALAGVAMKDPSMYQIASAEDQKNIQQQKQ